MQFPEQATQQKNKVDLQMRDLQVVDTVSVQRDKCSEVSGESDTTLKIQQVATEQDQSQFYVYKLQLNQNI